MPIIEGCMRYYGAGAVSAGTAAVQTLAFTGTVVTTGTIILSVEGLQTAPITVNATAATLVAAIDAALEALPNVGVGGVVTAATTYTAGAGNITCTFTPNRPVATMLVENNSMAGAPAPTLTITTTTTGARPVPFAPGVSAQYFNTATGAVPASNTGTAAAPVWTTPT
jgi:phage tail sheath gpL-like